MKTKDDLGELQKQELEGGFYVVLDINRFMFNDRKLRECYFKKMIEWSVYEDPYQVELDEEEKVILERGTSLIKKASMFLATDEWRGLYNQYFDGGWNYIFLRAFPYYDNSKLLEATSLLKELQEQPNFLFIAKISELYDNSKNKENNELSNSLDETYLPVASSLIQEKENNENEILPVNSNNSPKVISLQPREARTLFKLEKKSSNWPKFFVFLFFLLLLLKLLLSIHFFYKRRVKMKVN